MTPTPSIAAVAVKLPPYQVSQAEAMSGLTGFGGPDFERFGASAGVDTRRIAMPLADTGVDVANFMVQHVQPNVMHIDYDLSRPKEGAREGAGANLLIEAEEAGEDLLNTVAAYNIDLVDLLLGSGHAVPSTVAQHLIANWPEGEITPFGGVLSRQKGATREVG